MRSQILHSRCVSFFIILPYCSVVCVHPRVVCTGDGELPVGGSTQDVMCDFGVRTWMDGYNATICCWMYVPCETSPDMRHWQVYFPVAVRVFLMNHCRALSSLLELFYRGELNTYLLLYRAPEKGPRLAPFAKLSCTGVCFLHHYLVSI